MTPRCVTRTGKECGDCVECLSKHPEGKTCGDCRHVEKCLAMWGLKDRSRSFCGWYPSRFAAIVTPNDRASASTGEG